jgi:hypothetical protein
MSNRYKGAVISATPPTTTGGEDGVASGAWTLEQQMQLQAAGLWPAQPTGPFIEQVFSTYLYTGTGASLTIPNGINLSGKGGLTWTKSRSSTAFHKWYDSARGIANAIESNTTDANQNEPTGITSFNSNGYTYGTDGNTNSNGVSYVSWTFREQPKFFDIVTYTGNGGTLTVSHNLGSTPGCIMVKKTSGAEDWYVWHRSLAASNPNTWINLNLTSAATISAVFGGSSLPPTSTNFSVGPGVSVTNGSGESYVAYLFAHDAGGFGLTGTDNVISCGSFTQGSAVTLGYEPQWLLIKDSGASGSEWYLFDSMRGLTADGTYEPYLHPNRSNAEASFGSTPICKINATGFDAVGFGTGGPYIYIAIRRGPMKVPTDATKVYNAIARTGTGATATVTGAGFVPDLVIPKARSNSATATPYDRLRGALAFLQTSATNAESSAFTDTLTAFGMNGFTVGADASFGSINQNAYTYINWVFGRAPGFFDEVCYTGTGVARTITHNLAAVPELMIVKKRNAAASWTVYSKSIPITHNLILNNGTASAASAVWNSTAPTSSVFSVSTLGAVNANLDTYVAYLFATCPNVSKVGSYTGNGTTQTINCGFTGGARFVLLKRTDDVGDWYVYDTARGMTAMTDPYLWLNSTAAEVATLGSVTTVATGFALDSAILADINVSAGTYIFLAIA